MVRCKCGQEFENYGDWRAHYNELKPSYPYLLMVERGLIKLADFTRMKKAYEQFTEDHKVVE